MPSRTTSSSSGPCSGRGGLAEAGLVTRYGAGSCSGRGGLGCPGCAGRPQLPGRARVGAGRRRRAGLAALAVSATEARRRRRAGGPPTPSALPGGVLRLREFLQVAPVPVPSLFLALSYPRGPVGSGDASCKRSCNLWATQHPILYATSVLTANKYRSREEQVPFSRGGGAVVAQAMGSQLGSRTGSASSAERVAWGRRSARTTTW